MVLSMFKRVGLMVTELPKLFYNVCNDIPLFSSWFSIVGLFDRLVVPFLLRHNVDYVLQTCFLFVAPSGPI